MFSPYCERVIRGILQAVVLMAAESLVWLWLSDLKVQGAFIGRVPELSNVLRMSGIIGFVLGYIVPEWYRASRERPGDEEVVVESQDSLSKQILEKS